MKIIFQLGYLILLVSGCATIPVQSVALADAIQAEGERMHNLNVIFLNRIFDAKRETIERFIKEEYTPVVVANFTTKVNKEFPQTDFKKEFPDLLNALMPEINKRRDTLVRSLDLQKEKIVEKLNADYRMFDNAVFEMKKLLESAAKVDQQKQALYTQAKTLSNSRIDFNNLEVALDKFIHSSGNVAAKIPELNNTVDQLLNKK